MEKNILLELLISKKNKLMEKEFFPIFKMEPEYGMQILQKNL